jgi:hypothetical protein
MPRDKHGNEFGVGDVCELPHGKARIQGFYNGNVALTREEAKQIAMKLSSCRDPKVYFAHEVEVVKRPGLFARLWSAVWN